jgi:hypothetical protein
MVVDEQLRPLFAFLRAMPVPTSLFAAPEDWADPDLSKRIDRAPTPRGRDISTSSTETLPAPSGPRTTSTSTPI